MSSKWCPTCDGEGRIETMTFLSYNGAQEWDVQECEECGGTGVLDDDEDELDLHRRMIATALLLSRRPE